MKRFSVGSATLGNIIAVILVAITLLVLMAQQGSSAPVKAQGSIASRVQAQTDSCTVEGGTIEVRYEYSPVFSGAVTKATTTCKGGSDDGYTCVNTASITDCSRPLVRPTQPPFAGLPDTADPNGGDGIPHLEIYATIVPGLGNGVLVEAGDGDIDVIPNTPAPTPIPFDGNRATPVAADPK
jgi:hypothetical protein